MSRKSRARRKLERIRRAGLEISRREYEKGRIAPDDYAEIVEFWKNGEARAVTRAMKKGWRKGGPVGRLVMRPAIRLLGRVRKGED